MDKKKKYVFDGQIYAGRKAGVYRYANEILQELDKIVYKDEYEIVVPRYVNIEGKFKNIKVVHYGNVKGILWSQISLLGYLIKNHAVSIGFYNTTPLLKPGITVVHDIGYKVLHTHYKNLYGRISSLWHRLNYWIIAKSGMPIITVSNFSKKQIEDVYRVKSSRISIIGNGWQHYQRIIMDDSVFEDFPDIKPHEYYFALGSLEERKNFKWIMEVAKRNPDDTFVIAGGKVRNNKRKLDFNESKNIIFVGYVSDGQSKSLMSYCKAFIFPSTFEGFGIPPLEALSVGVKVLCSDIPCLHEICQESVVYFNPYKYDIHLEQMLCEAEYLANTVLENYSWKDSADKLIKLITRISCINVK